MGWALAGPGASFWRSVQGRLPEMLTSNHVADKMAIGKGDAHKHTSTHLTEQSYTGE